MEVLTVIISLLLLLVTTIYVVFTARIAEANHRAAEGANGAAQAAHLQVEESKRAVEASNRQVELTRQMLHEAREERLSAVRPTIVVEEVEASWRGEKVVALATVLRNIGPGVALVPQFRARIGDAPWVEGDFGPSALAIQERAQASFPLISAGQELGRSQQQGLPLDVATACLDVLGRRIYLEQRLWLQTGKSGALRIAPPVARNAPD